MPDFFPRRDSDLRDWARNFADRLSASPGDYGLTAAQVAGFVAVQERYAHWYMQSQQATTRTAACVRMKNEARKAMMAEGRELAAVVRARSETSSEQLVGLGLRSRRKRRQAAGVPGEVPRVRVREGRYGSWPKVRLEDAVTGRARKPAGAAMAVVLYAAGGESPLRLGDWKFALTTGDPVFRLSERIGVGGFVPAAGERVWLTACWVNDRGERGPWSEPVDWWVNGGVGVNQQARCRAA